MPKIIIRSGWIKVATKASQKISPTTRYTTHCNQPASKIERDIAQGILAEICTSWYLNKNGIYCSKPDTKVYKRKSFKADLQADGYAGLEVKSQSLKNSKRYGTSFAVHENYKPKCLIVVVLIQDDWKWAEVLGHINPVGIKLGKPKLKHLKNKKFIYLANNKLVAW